MANDSNNCLDLRHAVTLSRLQTLDGLHGMQSPVGFSGWSVTHRKLMCISEDFYILLPGKKSNVLSSFTVLTL